ncbi:MAG: FHA domain-containing protein [Bacteriovoracaceae bacterium]|jgi:hypothetical protein|nr:hypothetical protein [Halobacteriovoraceae bacterium]MDP7321572.1 FHA domain-containing protein [Bacteriovoracaceae bacterium]
MLSTSETYQFTVGSSSGCDVKIDDHSISRVHVKIYFSEESVLIEDLNSSKGTFVLHNGEFKRIKSAKIKPETQIRLGHSFGPIEVKKLIDDFILLREKDKKDIAKRVKNIGLRRCSECGTVLSKAKIHCDCCGAILDESA